MRRETCSCLCDAEDSSGTALRLEMSKAEELAAVLSEALCNEPHFRYVIPEDHTRLRFLRGFFGSAIRASQLNGEIYTTPRVDGGALWIGPGRGLTLASTITLSPAEALKRCINLLTHLDEVHQQLLRGPHWYLLAVGAKPSGQNENVEGLLLEPLLARADSDDLPCYLETFNDNYLFFYERHGFRIAGSGKIPGGGPDFWAMIRRPSDRSKVF